MDTDTPERPKVIIRLKKVLSKTGQSRAGIYQAMADGNFPKPVKLSKNSRSVGWIESEIDDFIDTRIAARDGVAA